MNTSLSTDQLRAEIQSLGPWFHNMDLGGVETAPDHFLGDYPRVKWQRFCHAVPADLHGKSVLDVGCNGGYYSIEMKRRGAERVVAIDSDEGYLAQARFAARVSGADIEFLRMSVYDVEELGERFDVVLFLGVLYHLRYPLLALDILYEHAVGDMLVFQSMLRGHPGKPSVEPDYPFTELAVFDKPEFPRLYFIERSYAGDPTNWWIPNRACVEAMLKSAGFQIASQPEDEVFICRRDRVTQRDGAIPAITMRRQAR